MKPTIPALAVFVGLVAVAFPSGARPSSTEREPLTLLTQATGRWLAEGRDAAGRAFSAVLDVEPGPGGRLAYARRVVAQGGVRVVDPPLERGEAFVRDDRLLTREVVPGRDLIGGVGRLEVVAAAPRCAVYHVGVAGPHVLVGRWEAAEAHGTEVMRRSDADNDVQLLIDGPETFPSIYAAVRGARRQICLQTFSWFDDRAGREMADLLIAKLHEGVEVRCLIEAFPQKGGVGWETGEYLRDKGIDLRLHHTVTEGVLNGVKSFFRRLWPWSRPAAAQEKRGLFNHDHRKLIVVDGQVAFTGGMNIGDKYLEATTWHDLHTRVEGSAVDALEALFWDRWHAAGGEGEAAPHARRPGPGALPVEVLDNLPGVHLDVTTRYLREIEAAQVEILIENPYLLYDPVVRALEKKAQTGVGVVVILPSNDLNDEAFARDAFLWVQNSVVRTGIELHKYRQRMCHGKVAVFDRRVATIGTTNLDQVALERNAELNLWVADRGFARTITERVIRADLPLSDPVKVAPLPWWRKVVARTMYAIRSFL